MSRHAYAIHDLITGNRIGFYFSLEEAKRDMEPEDEVLYRYELIGKKAINPVRVEVEKGVAK